MAKHWMKVGRNLALVALAIGAQGCTQNIYKQDKSNPAAQSQAPSNGFRPYSGGNGTGGLDGGGARAVVCRDGRGSLKSAELLDFFEARVRFGRTLERSNEPPAARAKAAMEAFGKSMLWSTDPGSLIEWTERVGVVQAKMRTVKGRLFYVPDSNEPIGPTEPGCAIEQLANYTDDDELLVDEEILSALDNVNHAGFLAHEAMYKMLREIGEPTSTRVRRAVGLQFSGFEFKPLDGLAMGWRRWKCHSLAISTDPEKPFDPRKTASFALVISVGGSENSIELHFEKLGVHRMFGPSVVRIKFGERSIFPLLSAGPGHEELRPTLSHDGAAGNAMHSEVDKGWRVGFMPLTDSLEKVSFYRSERTPTGTRPVQPEALRESFRFKAKVGFDRRNPYPIPDIEVSCRPDELSWPDPVPMARSEMEQFRR